MKKVFLAMTAPSMPSALSAISAGHIYATKNNG